MTLIVYLYGLKCETVEDFLLFLSVLSFSISLVLADSVSYRDPIARITFHDSSHSIRLPFIHSLDINLFCPSRLHCCSCTEVNTTAFSPIHPKNFTLANMVAEKKGKGFGLWSGWSRGGGAVYCTVLCWILEFPLALCLSMSTGGKRKSGLPLNLSKLLPWPTYNGV